jgi:exopolysaccharide production protein ExoY
MIASISGRSPFVAHRRIAQGGRSLWVLKLRTMWDNRWRPNRPVSQALVERLTPENPTCWIQKAANDPRVTSAFAAFCRRYSLDELPQLWHVIRGELALVGPRPLTEYELDRYYGPDTGLVLSQRPGLTGLWQIRGRSRLNYRQRRRLDVFLIRKWSLALYFRIIFATLPNVISGKNAW